MNLFANSTHSNSLLISIIITSLVLIIRDIVGIDINQYMIFLLMSVCFIILPKRDVHSYLAFTCGIVYGVNAYILLVGVCTILLKDSKIISKNFCFILFFLILIFWEIVNCNVHYLDPQFSNILLYAANLLVFFYYFLKPKRIASNRETLLFYSIGLGLTIFIICVGILRNPLDLVFDTASDVRGAMGFSDDHNETHFFANANNLAYLSIVLSSLVLSLRKQIFHSNVVFYTLLILSLLAGLLSSSRTWTLLCILLFILLFLLINFKTKLKAVIISFVIVAIILSIFPNFITVTFEGILGRFELDNLATAGNRTNLFNEYSNFMSSNSEYTLTGTGAIYYKDIAKCSNSCHNAFQQIYVAYGLLGCIFFISAFFMSIRNRERSCSIINYLPFIFALLFIQSIQFLNPFYLMIPVAFTSIAYKI